MRRQRQKALKKVLATSLMVAALGGCAGWAYAGENTCEFVYDGVKNEFVASGSELFSLVDEGLPGDVFVGTMSIVNDASVPCEVFVSAEDVVTNGPGDMLERIPFMVTADDEVVLEEVLGSVESREPLSVGLLEPGETLNVHCKTTIPTDLTNEYAGAAVGLNMALTVEERESGGSTGLVQTGGNGSGDGASLVHAGDALAAVPFVLGALAAAGAVIWCAWKRRMRMW